MNLTEKRNLEKSIRAIAERRIAKYQGARSSAANELQRAAQAKVLSEHTIKIDRLHEAAREFSDALEAVKAAGLTISSGFSFRYGTATAKELVSNVSASFQDVSQEHSEETAVTVTAAQDAVEEAVIALWSGEMEIGELVKKLDAIFA